MSPARLFSLLWPACLGYALLQTGYAPGFPVLRPEPTKIFSPKSDPFTFDYAVKPWYKYRPDGKPGREVLLYFPKTPLSGKILLTTEWEGKKEVRELAPATPCDSLAVLLPANAGLSATTVNITLQNGERQYQRQVAVPASKQWTVYIYPHSHVDIGYTNLQEVVEDLHVRNIDVGIDIARKTQHYPEGARFIWNPEATWVVRSYLKKASPQQKKSFVEAVRKGWIQIDGAHSNLNTSACSDEELLRVFENNHAIAAATGVPITTMVQMDNPGGSWGLVQAAAQNGVKAFFSFPNYYDLRHSWDHKPFYWVAQNGKDRIFFLQAASYGWGYRLKGSIYGLAKTQSLSPKYDRVSTADPLKNFIDPFIFQETAKLEKANSPYDIYAMTWSMADNCLIDADLPEAVRLWNERYAFPKLKIAGIKEIHAAYEAKYGSVIPEYKGDFTEFWTNGLGSDARRVGMGRRGKENLVQAEALWALLGKNRPAPVDSLSRSWEQLLLASEHTWGYQDPRAPLAKKVEANKAAFFEQAESSSKEWIRRALEPVAKKEAPGIAVVNTLSWPRGGIVTLSPEQGRAGDRVVDDQGKEVLSQRLSSGELIFRAENIPALGSRLYKVLPGRCSLSGDTEAGAALLQNSFLTATLDPATGNISRLLERKTGRELVRPSSPVALNSYHYLLGVKNGKDSTFTTGHPTQVALRVKEKGPLLVSLEAVSEAPGCRSLTREVRLFSGQPYLELVNTVDKIATRKKEGIHFGFDFNVPQGVVRMDIPWGNMVPDQDQVPSANKNWFTFQRHVDISNPEYGLTWTCIESPLVEVGGLSGNILDGARQPWNWLKSTPPSQTLYSWPLNNHWDTNFPLEQGGLMSFRYQVLPHGKYDPVVAARFGLEQNRPFVVVATDKNPVDRAPVSVDNPNIMISTLKKSADNKALILRLKSVSGQPERVTLGWPAGTPRSVRTCGADERPGPKSPGTVMVLPYGMTTFRLEF
ncbi:glycoside hydrolase family 38 C-terminal domain-containing protein [Paraflavisolibacter sp. H34]|uniref:glycoside hydrolase family 38 N-terminal domain-containing protein n=1 Tax=Huijunlia imazamoxiresistens TaxID=3127457 RepID=UPI003015D166